MWSLYLRRLFVFEDIGRLIWKHGAVHTETGPAVWLLGNQGKTWNGRLWTRLLIPTCGELYAAHSGRQHLKIKGFISAMFILCFCLDQDTGVKIAVKHCRQGLSFKNRERWRREIQIMTKWLLFVVYPNQRSATLKEPFGQFSYWPKPSQIPPPC